MTSDSDPAARFLALHRPGQPLLLTYGFMTGARAGRQAAMDAFPD